MNASPRPREPHLTLREHRVAPGTEWKPRAAEWAVILVRGGSGLCLRPESNDLLQAGCMVMLGGHSFARLRASAVEGLVLTWFGVSTRSLGGLLTLGEHQVLRAAAESPMVSARVLPADAPAVISMKECLVQPCASRLLAQLRLLEVFALALGTDLDTPAEVQQPSDSRDRLRVLLDRCSAHELMETTFEELARRTHCTPRHLSRLFRELTGMTFRDKRVELRLARARELLATSNCKIVDVAFESGFKSLSPFNLMFARRFGDSPSAWRRKQAAQRASRRGRASRMPLTANPAALTAVA